MHPFGLRDDIDEVLEDNLKLSIPFADSMVGIQGAGESMSFVFANENPSKSKAASLDENKDLFKFFGDQYWKTSSYLSTISSAFILSSLVAIIEAQEEEVTMIIKDWLQLLFRIKDHPRCYTLSLSVISKLLLKEEYNINSTARDVILKPILYNLDVE